MTRSGFRSRGAQSHIPWRWERSGQRGSVTVELVLLTPLLVALVIFVIYAGRAGQSVEQIRHAADQGARAASLVRRDAMADEARRAVQADLARNGHPCSGVTVSVRVDVRSVTVDVSCQVDRQGLALLGLGTRSLRASSTEVIDVYRGGP